MSAFTNYLSKSGLTILKDYQHATRLYVDNNYLKSPKVGFLYFITFNINPNAILDKGWAFKNSQEVGLLVKKIDLPKYNVTVETLNQYNRKTAVQTKLNYNPVTIEFHDDNADIINNLWVNYYQFYYADSNYGGSSTGESERNQRPPEFRDTKYGVNDYKYGRYQYKDVLTPFFTSVDIYVLHQHMFTQMTLVNPKITEWSHDSLNQADGGKILQNRMNLAYENVFYNQGFVAQNSPEGFGAAYYDNQPSPNAIAGNSKNQPNYSRGQSAFDQPGKDRVYGRIGGPGRSGNVALDLATILAKNYLNKNGLGKAGSVGYNISTGVLGALGSAGKFAEPPSTENQTGVFNLPGGVGINIFKGLNTSVDGKVRVNPAAIIFPKLGGGG